MEVIRYGSTGAAVFQWQAFIRGLNKPWSKNVVSNGTFDDETVKATRSFQSFYKLDVDGIVGQQSWKKAIALGMSFVEGDDGSTYGATWPPKPKDHVFLSYVDRVKLFGNIQFVPAPVPSNPERIRITNGWDKNNIVSVKVPQLQNVPYFPKNGTIDLHRLVVDQFMSLVSEWEKLGLIDRIEVWSGSWAPRFIRGSRTVLSNHAFGTAFDINSPTNMLGRTPALKGQKGSVRELVESAWQFGWNWGGWWDKAYSGSGSRSDGMHFELCRLL